MSTPKDSGLMVAMGVVEEIKRPGAFIEIVKRVRQRMGAKFMEVWVDREHSSKCTRRLGSR